MIIRRATLNEELRLFVHWLLGGMSELEIGMLIQEAQEHADYGEPDPELKRILEEFIFYAQEMLT